MNGTNPFLISAFERLFPIGRASSSEDDARYDSDVSVEMLSVNTVTL